MGTLKVKIFPFTKQCFKITETFVFSSIFKSVEKGDYLSDLAPLCNKDCSQLLNGLVYPIEN